MSFEKLGLKPEILNAVTAQGYSEATPIQMQAIPEILKGKDVLAGAQTGTGKTAAFALPILNILSDTPNSGRAPRALILTPTRELAAQIYDCIEHYSRYLTIKCAVIFGGVSLRPQIEQLKTGIDILVATPGRLIDHVMKRTLNLSKVEIFVLDEADRMLDMGFIHDIRKIIPMLPAKRQNLLFSATYTKEIKVLADKILTRPVSIEVDTENSAVDKIDQIIHPVERAEKKDLLAHLITSEEWKQVLVFTRTKHGANRLATQLNSKKINAVAIHGNKSQSARTEALSGFKGGKITVLVATDIAARGIDISLLPHVVNYDLPEIAENYIHRIGRTGRAGANGKAVSLVCPEDHKELKQIQKLLGCSIDVQKIAGFDADLSLIPDKPKREYTFNRNREREAAESMIKGEAPKDNFAVKPAKKRENFNFSSKEDRFAEKRDDQPRGRGRFVKDSEKTGDQPKNQGRFSKDRRVSPSQKEEIPKIRVFDSNDIKGEVEKRKPTSNRSSSSSKPKSSNSRYGGSKKTNDGNKKRTYSRTRS
ncbi:MAG: DEAD/DEAH box helicase [Candidatus Delongbacteria bacterium]|nr:DEAD/DEAH box helicase [Candidatus Delongbacteria bacterium]MBN2835722.1 DEAD/DEAH box helicase [Candidatus Delongbacteria bacterium]